MHAWRWSCSAAAAVAVLLAVRVAAAQPAPSSRPVPASQPVTTTAPAAKTAEAWPRWEAAAGVSNVPFWPGTIFGPSVSAFYALRPWLAIGVEYWSVWLPHARYRRDGYYASTVGARVSLPRRVSPFAQVSVGLFTQSIHSEDAENGWYFFADVAPAVGLDVHISPMFTLRVVSVEAVLAPYADGCLIRPRLTCALVVRFGRR